MNSVEVSFFLLNSPQAFGQKPQLTFRGSENGTRCWTSRKRHFIDGFQVALPMGIGMLQVTKFDFSSTFQICVHTMSRSKGQVSIGKRFSSASFIHQSPLAPAPTLSVSEMAVMTRRLVTARWSAEHVLQRSGPPRGSWRDTQSFIARDVAFGLQGRAFEHICVPKSLKKTRVPFQLLSWDSSS